MAPKPETKPKREPRTFRNLELVRNGNDDYTAVELTITGDGDTWRTVGRKVLADHVSRNVVSADVERWFRDYAGRDFYGDTHL